MNAKNETSNEPKAKPDDLRAEYTALCQFYGQVIGFRFTAATIYFAGIAFIMQSGLSNSKLFLMMLFSIGMWVVEVRNRGIYYILGARAVQIERDHWGYKDKTAYHPLFQRMFRPDDLASEHAPKPTPDPVRLLWFYIPKPPQWVARLLSHTMGFDLVYLGIIGFSIWHLGLRDVLIRLF